MKASFYLTLIIFIAENSYAQDPLFVQSHSNAIYLNPALTGCFINPVISAGYRNQWPETSSGGFRTSSVSYHQFVNALHGGAGFYYMYDNAGSGTMQTYRINASYAAHFEIADVLVVRVGVTGGYVNRKVDWDQLTFGDLIDPRYGFVYPTQQTKPPSTKSFFDCGIGTVAYIKNVYAGVAVDHLNQPDESFLSEGDGSELPAKLVLNVGGYIPIGDSSNFISINPDLLYEQQRDFTVTIPTVTFRLKYVLLGVGFRNDNTTMLMLGFENNFLRIGYSYDRSFSDNFNYDSNEIFVSVKLIKIAPKKRKWKAINMEAF